MLPFTTTRLPVPSTRVTHHFDFGSCWLQVWLGYKQSLRPCENGLTLNIDVAATAFLSPDPVLKYLSNILRRPEESLTLDSREDLRKAEKAIRNLKARHPPVTRA